MKGIFKTLFDLKLKSHNQPLEDYLTELFAHCLRTNIELCKQFMLHFDIKHELFDRCEISTQHKFKGLENHHSGSIPDMAFSMKETTIFFENKVNSSEGWEQLKRYAEHLNEFPSKYKTLVYLTKNFEEKDKDMILEKCSNVDFIPLRWSQVFHFFKKYKENPIIEEFLQFMKQTKIAMNNKIMPADILTMSNISNVLSIMKQTMEGEVEKKFKSINHKSKLSKQGSSLQGITWHDRYMHYADYKDKLWMGLGYSFNANTSKDYPEVCLIIELDPSSSNKNEILKWFKSIDKSETHKNWKGYNLNTPTNWFGVKIRKSLRDFLSSENQLKEIEDFFNNKLDELVKIFSEHPEFFKR